MRRTTAALISVALSALFLVPAPRAFGLAAHPRPIGIAASAWLPISSDFGAVIEQPSPNRHARDRQLPSALGYFAIWRKGRWLRLDSVLQQPPLRRSLRPASRLPIAANLEFVIEHERRGSALGYFAVKRGGHWVRLDPIPQDALFRGPLTAHPTPERVRISSTLQFVIEQQMPERFVPRRGPSQLPSVLGYFMGKRAGEWVRLGSIA